MNHRLGVRVLAALLSVAAVLPGAAHAEKVVTEDLADDAQAFTYYQEFQYVPAPQEATADITRTVAALGTRRLSVTVHFRDLRARPRHTTLVRVRTPRSTVDVLAERESARRPRGTVSTTRGEELGCQGLRVRYDGAADRVSLSVPAACIGSPRWVRLGVGATATPEANPENPSTVVLFTDDGHRDTFSEDSLGTGPRIRRG